MADPPTPPTRPDLYVVARFLDKLCQPGPPHTRSRLQAAVRLNYDLFRSYLAWLVLKGFATEETDAEDRALVRITSKGLDAHHQLVEWIRRTLGSAF